MNILKKISLYFLKLKWVPEVTGQQSNSSKWTLFEHSLQFEGMRWMQGLFDRINLEEGSSWSQAWYATYSATSYNKHGDHGRRGEKFSTIFMPIFFVITTW